MKRFEYVGKTASTLEDVDIQVQKQGQKDTVPAILLTFLTKHANTWLDKLDPTLLPFLYSKKGNPNKGSQPGLEGVEPVTSMPFLTDAAVKMGASFDWDFEQTGTRMVIYRGTARDKSNIKLKDGTISKLRVTLMEGGTVHVRHCYYVADIDSDTIGEIAVLKKKQQLEVEVLAPELVDQQKGIQDVEPPVGAQSPEAALAASVVDKAKKGPKP